MKVKQVLHMNKGDGETSYAKNSIVQSKIISRSKSIMAEAVEKLLITAAGIPESMGAADLGCSSGPNTLLVMSDLVRLVHSTCIDLGHPFPDELRISLNDLPTNDFNHIFSALLSGFYEKLTAEMGLGSRRCFVSAVAGSFYDRLFPRRSLHFVHSSSSLHWLSQVPAGLTAEANKGKIYISKTSHKSAMDAYAVQFNKDFSTFLRSRSEEVVPGGRMVLSFIGRGSMDPTTEESCYQWELLAQALMEMAREGLVEEKKIDSFNAPYYAPCQEEIRQVIKQESCFDIDRLEAFDIDWDGGVGAASDRVEGSDKKSKSVLSGRRVARTIRAVVEPMLRSHFGQDLNMDDLFRRYEEIVGDYLSKSRGFYVNLIISLVRNG